MQRAAARGLRAMMTMVAVCASVVVLFVVFALFGSAATLVAATLFAWAVVACWVPTAWTWYRSRQSPGTGGR